MFIHVVHVQIDDVNMLELEQEIDVKWSTYPLGFSVDGSLQMKRQDSLTDTYMFHTKYSLYNNIVCS